MGKKDQLFAPETGPWGGWKGPLGLVLFPQPVGARIGFCPASEYSLPRWAPDRYGVLIKELGIPLRGLFIIDPQGVVQQVRLITACPAD